MVYIVPSFVLNLASPKVLVNPPCEARPKRLTAPHEEIVARTLNAFESAGIIKSMADSEEAKRKLFKEILDRRVAYSKGEKYEEELSDTHGDIW